MEGDVHTSNQEAAAPPLGITVYSVTLLDSPASGALLLFGNVTTSRATRALIHLLF